jgi:RNA polymerase subunit RPABC4/transcription elongation factor Spt4
VNVLGIGFDVPDASCGILARPTLSEALDMQQKGRLLRPAQAKSGALLLDHAGNTLRFGLPVNFTVPDLNSGDRPTTKAKRKQRKVIPCTSCGFVLEPDQVICPSCGIERPGRFSKVSYVDADLVEYGSEDDGKPTYTQAEKQRWYLAFLSYARRYGKKDGYAYHLYLKKFNDKPVWAWRYLDPVEPTEEQSRWLQSRKIAERKRWEKEKAQRKQRVCPACGSFRYRVTKGSGPHAAGKRCADCNKHLGWIAKGEVERREAIG